MAEAATQGASEVARPVIASALTTLLAFAPIMAMAGRKTIVQAAEIVPVGAVDPECVVTPGIFVNTIVEVPDPQHESLLVAEERTYP